MTTASSHQLRVAAQDIEKIAKRLRRRADEVDARSEWAAQHKRDIKRLKQLGRDVARVAHWQISRVPAAAEVHPRPFGTPIETVIHYAKEACHTAAAQRRAQRNRQVIHMARTGYTNRDIAAKVGVSARTVSRIITDSFRDPL